MLGWTEGGVEGCLDGDEVGRSVGAADGWLEGKLEGWASATLIRTITNTNISSKCIEWQLSEYCSRSFLYKFFNGAEDRGPRKSSFPSGGSLQLWLRFEFYFLKKMCRSLWELGEIDLLMSQWSIPSYLLRFVRCLNKQPQSQSKLYFRCYCM